jgi:alpha-beta hydrolase superfamily lysophospholipase
LVLLLHGNGGDRSQSLESAEIADALGCSELLISHRAHGDSTGAVNDIGFSARHDVVAAVEWLERESSGRPIIAWGRSLGAAALRERVQGYILECPYQDLPTAVRNRVNMRLPVPLCTMAYAGLRLVAPLVLPDVDEISPLQAARAVPESVPVLLLAGDEDRLALPREARAIQHVIGPSAQLVTIAGGEHLQLARADPQRYRDTVISFLALFRSAHPRSSPPQD